MGIMVEMRVSMKWSSGTCLCAAEDITELPKATVLNWNKWKTMSIGRHRKKEITRSIKLTIKILKKIQERKRNPSTKNIS